MRKQNAVTDDDCRIPEEMWTRIEPGFHGGKLFLPTEASQPRESYRSRHLVENFFVDLKQFRGIATHYCKLAESYVAFINLAGWFLDTKATGRTPSMEVESG